MATLRKDGRWMARRMIQGKSWTAYGATREEADTNLRLVLGDTLSTPTGSRLHDVAVRLWWPNLEYVSHASKTRYVGVYRQYIADSIGIMEIGEVNVSDCQAVIREAGRRLSPSSLSLIRSVMHQIFKAAQADGLIGKNPADFLEWLAHSPHLLLMRTIGTIRWGITQPA